MKHLFLAIYLMAGVACTVQAQTSEVLTGTQSGSKTLTTEKCYHLEDCYIVDAGDTLTIDAGVTIRCDEGSSLIIQRGAYIYANGTAMSPVVFTSDKAVNDRSAGDWVGIVVAGYAKNNVVSGGSGDLAVQRCGVTYKGGGTNDADNSGVIQYTRIEFAGGSGTGSTVTNALDLVSVGSGTQIHDVQISESGQDAFWVAGGTVNMKNLLSLNAYQNGFHFSYGNGSKVQFLLDLRKDVNAHVSAGSNGLFIENNPGGNSNTPLTQPLISNFTAQGPASCGTTVSTDFQDGVRFDHNGAGTIRNSAIQGWPDNGFLIQDAASIGHTATNDLNFSSNAIIAVSGGNLYAAGASWATGCGGSLSSMAKWITSMGLMTCEESGNTFSLTHFGYNTDLCDDYCDARPTLTRSGTALNGTDFSAPFNTFFSSVNYKGAIGATDYTADWGNYCPQTTSYCSVGLEKAASEKVGIQLVPNPANGSVRAYFHAKNTGSAQLSILDPVTGEVLRQVEGKIREAGKQFLSFSVKGLRTGVYPVVIQMKDAALTGQIVVR